MFGNLNPAFREHQMAPIAKLIDFGNTYRIDEAVEGNAPQANLFRAARAVYLVAVRRKLPNVNDTPGMTQLALRVDNGLRDLLRRSLATNIADRPTLAQMLQAATDAVNKSYALVLRGRETDASVQRFVSEVILNADT
ncbi:Uu.00g012700.m01.CDS01 [Anthostomella pinea]|uniref:Uu.00g012700.m01.CDS01 n=1 Tax=Anthostomella pinea TaxID=933095 RepID=A0AAI8VS83_9PEZI|nr:Uu.00g012700.m01.CDS01 [Anthostomella pinea]